MEIPAILGSLQIPAATAPSAPVLAGLLAGQAVEATLEAILPDGLLLRFADGRQLQAQGSLPYPPGSALALVGVPLPQGAGLRLQVVRSTPPPSPALLAPLTFGEAAPLLARLQSSASGTPLGQLLGRLVQAGLAVAEQPGTWTEWLKQTMQALADPAASPAESTFHRLQAREGTGWFEVPLPWAPGGTPLQLWIEEDAGPGGGELDRVHRVLLSVAFSALGEVRLGLEQRSAGLRVRLWLRDPGQVTALREDLEAELASLGRPVDLQLLTLPPEAPDLRALAGGSPLQAMG